MPSADFSSSAPPAAQDLALRVARYSAYLQSDPDNIALLTDLGDLQRQAGDIEGALVSYKRAAELSPSNAALLTRMAAVHLALHHFADAAGLYHRLQTEGTADAALQHNYGIALFYQGRYQDAARQFSLAAAAGLPGPANVRYLANCHHHLGELEQAVGVAEQWAAAGDDADGQAYLSLLYLDLGQNDKAQANADAALIEKPDNVDAHAVRGSVAMEQLDIATALASFDKVLAQRPDYGRAWLGKGLAHMYGQEMGAALQSLQQAALCMPEHAATQLTLGWAQMMSGQSSEAEQSFRRAAALDGQYADARGGLAAALVSQNRLDEARQELAASDRLNPNDFGASYAKAQMLRLDGKDRQAERLMDGALEQRPEAGGPSLKEYLSNFMARHPLPPQR